MTSFRQIRHRLAPRKWQGIIVDDVQHVKNPKTQLAGSLSRFQMQTGGFKMIISGTPLEVINE